MSGSSFWLTASPKSARTQEISKSFGWVPRTKMFFDLISLWAIECLLCSEPGIRKNYVWYKSHWNSKHIFLLVLWQKRQINTQYMSYSNIVSTRKMESVSKSIIFVITMMVKRVKKIKSLHAGRWLFLLLNLWFWAKIFPFMQYGKLVSRMEGLQNKFLYTNFHHLFRPNGLFLDINSFLRVKTMYEQLI